MDHDLQMPRLYQPRVNYYFFGEMRSLEILIMLYIIKSRAYTSHDLYVNLA